MGTVSHPGVPRGDRAHLLFLSITLSEIASHLCLSEAPNAVHNSLTTAPQTVLKEGARAPAGIHTNPTVDEHTTLAMASLDTHRWGVDPLLPLLPPVVGAEPEPLPEPPGVLPLPPEPLLLPPVPPALSGAVGPGSPVLLSGTTGPGSPVLLSGGAGSLGAGPLCGGALGAGSIGSGLGLESSDGGAPFPISPPLSSPPPPEVPPPP